MMAVQLAVPAYCRATVVPAFEVCRFFMVGCIATVGTGIHNVSDLGAVALFFLISLSALFLSLIWFLTWMGLYALLLKALWSNPPRWLRLPEFRTLSNRDFGVLVTSVCPIAIALLNLRRVQRHLGRILLYHKAAETNDQNSISLNRYFGLTPEGSLEQQLKTVRMQTNTIDERQ